MMKLKKIKKRMFAGILSVVMAVSSSQLPAGIAYAEEIPVEAAANTEGAPSEDAEGMGHTAVVPEDVPEEKADAPAGGDEDGSKDKTGPVEDSEEGKTDPEKPETDSEDNKNGSGEGEAEEESKEPGDAGNESDPEKTDGDNQELDEIPDLGKDEEEAAGDADESLGGEGNDGVQVSGNDLVETVPLENELLETPVEAKIDGAYQFGGAPAKKGGHSVFAVSPQDSGVEDYLYQQMKARKENVDISAYKVAVSSVGSVVSGVLNEHPDLYYVNRGFSYYKNDTLVISLIFTYSDTYDDNAFAQNTAKALAAASGGKSNLEKAIILHDYLTVNCEYDYQNYQNGTIPDASYTSYGVLVNGEAVCQGYALAYKYLLNQVGIDCYMVTSDKMNHAWNMIVLDGENYQVDVTWDDPTWDLVGRARHTYMFLSDAAFTSAGSGHHDWQVTSGSEDVGYTATDTRYDSAFWSGCNSPLVMMGDGCYYVSSSGKSIMKAGLSDITSAGTVVRSIGSWPVWGGGGSWSGAYSGLFQIDGRLYYNDKSCIYSISPDGTDRRTEFTADTTNGYIYGSALRRGKVVYCLHQTPNLEEKETVLTADIDAGSGEPDVPEVPDIPEENKGLNLDNLSATYTALDGTEISSAAQGKPKLLIFYSNGCGNSKGTIAGISGKISDFAGVDIYAVEMAYNTKESVAQFQAQYGCEEIVFSYSTGMVNSNSMWDYVALGGFEDNEVTWPVICYIDANNRLQYITTSYSAADTVLSNLKKYCGYTQDAAQGYKITYILNGGANSSANPSSYTEQTDTILLQDATRAGYRFAGWYKDSAYQEKVTEITKGSKGDITLYAKWSLGSSSGSGMPEIDVTPAQGNVAMGFSGAYYTESADKILARLNEIRLEACKEGVENPSSGQPLTEADYVPLTWSSDLEAIARLRAAEATVKQAHERPNGERCFTAVTTNNEQSWAENLAWNNSGLMAGIDQWYREKADWVNKTGETTGHYTSIINPEYHSVAVGAFRLSSGGWYAVAQEFSHKDSLDAQKNPEQGECVQPIEVQGSKVTGLVFDKNLASSVREGDGYQLSLTTTVQYDDIYGNAKTYTGAYLAGGSWSSSDESVAVVDGFGFVTAKSSGTARITVSAGVATASFDLSVYGEDASPLQIQRPAKTTYKVGQKLDLSGGKVTYMSGTESVTKALSQDMVSGFDSSAAGICKVTVTCGGYAGSFDALIVEEPELDAEYGKKLKDVSFPKSEYGTYTWADDTLSVGEVGVQTFTAVFTPKDEEAFQKLTDIEVKVRVHQGLTGMEIAFKADTFFYNGAEQEPKVVVSVSDKVLVENRDYTLSYRNNKNVGTATVIVEGMDHYYGSTAAAFEIKPASVIIRAKDKTILIGEKIPSKDEYEYEVSGLVSGESLKVLPGMFCGIASTGKAGQYEIVPAGADAGGNYTISYVNGRLLVASEYVSCRVAFDVQGYGTAPGEYIDVKVGSTIRKPDDPSAAGYQFGGWCKDAACTKEWNFDTDIVQEDMTLYAKWFRVSGNGSFSLQEISDVSYTGNACKPAVNVYDGETLLKAGRDYQVRYANNINTNKDGVQKEGNGEGKYFNPDLPYVEIIGRGNYTDTVKINFNILRVFIGDGSENPADKVTLKYTDQFAVAKKPLKPFGSLKYIKSMKPDKDFKLTLAVVNARDESGKNMKKGTVLENSAIPSGCEGTFLLTLQGIGNYTGSICKEIQVADKGHLIKNAKITLGKNLKNVELTDKGVELTPSETDSEDAFTVKCANTALRYNRDYRVSYRNNDRVGKAELIITGMGEYAGTKTASFNIKGKAFTAKNVSVVGLEDQVYTGRAWTQNEAVLTYADGTAEAKQLKYGTDYTISYSRNINKGTASVTFNGIAQAGYSGKVVKTFKIAAADITKVKRAEGMQDITVCYSRAGAKPTEEIVLRNGEGMALQNGKDYTLRYKNNRSVAKSTDENPPIAIVKGKGNYEGEFEVYFNIDKGRLDADNIKIKASAVAYRESKAADYSYEPAIKLTEGKAGLRAGTDYEITYEKNTQADYEAYLQGLAQQGAKEDDMPRAVITEKAGSSYTLDGQIVVPLPIYQNKFTKSNLKVEIEEAVYTGGQVTPKVTVSYQGQSGSVGLTENKDYTVSYGTNTKSGKRAGSVTISGVGPYYGGDVTVKFEILRKEIKY